MTGISHATAGITAGLILSEKLNIDPMISIGMCTLGSLIVDIDSEQSLVNRFLIPTPNIALSGVPSYLRKNKYLLKIGLGVCMQLASPFVIKYIGLILILSSICGKMEARFSLFGGVEFRKYHRTLFHDPVLGAILLSIPLFIYPVQREYVIPYLTGILLHYLLDSFTHAGLYSIVLRRFYRMPLHFRSGNVLAEALLISGCAAYIASSNTILNLI